MMKKICFLTLVVVLPLFTVAQQKLLRINAKSEKVDIKDGDKLEKEAWTIMPELKPDIYYTSTKGQRVTFYTDKDSVSVMMTETTVFDFIISLNDTAEAWTSIRYKPTYLETLKKAAKYNYQDLRPVPVFTYQDSSNEHLRALRLGFNLDSIAGKGNDASRILNVLHWLHNLVPHDGQHGNPEVMNAMNMLAVCKAEKRGLNCRGLSTVLNECYLALGYKSRFVTGLPKDTADTECHVINMVYCNDLKKWIWVDATHDSYVMDENGTLLSVEEVRTRLIDGRPLHINPDANWNHTLSTVKEDYLYNYMAKNLYRFSCPVHSMYDTETTVKDKELEYIELLSLDYHEQKPDVSVEKRRNGLVTFKTYRINNPEVFWQTPPAN